jgi:hypothetical protein
VNFVSHKLTHSPKIAKELTSLLPCKNWIKKISSLLKNKKYGTHNRYKDRITQ